MACTRRFFTRQYRATQAGVTVEVVHPQLVFERDEWVCGICSHPINRMVKAPHGMSPSLDHIVPLARGGAHSYANVQAAHLGCNRLKGSLIASH